MPISATDLDFETLIQQHMEAQPYEATCAECGREITVESQVDKDFDLRLTVPVCECASNPAAPGGEG